VRWTFGLVTLFGYIFKQKKYFILLFGILGYLMDINVGIYLVVLKSKIKLISFLISLQDITSDFFKNNINWSQWITNRWITEIGKYPKKSYIRPTLVDTNVMQFFLLKRTFSPVLILFWNFRGSLGASLSSNLPNLKPCGINFSTFSKFKNLQAWFKSQVQLHVHITHSSMLDIVEVQSFITN